MPGNADDRCKEIIDTLVKGVCGKLLKGKG
jgi:hypothetical protein